MVRDPEENERIAQIERNLTSRFHEICELVAEGDDLNALRAQVFCARWQADRAATLSEMTKDLATGGMSSPYVHACLLFWAFERVADGTVERSIVRLDPDRNMQLVTTY